MGLRKMEDNALTEQLLYKESRNGSQLTCILVPDSKDSEHKGTKGSCKEASPIIPHSKVGGGDLDAEKNPQKELEREQG